MKEYAHIRNAVFGQPWAIREETLDIMSAIVSERLVGEVRAFQRPEKDEDEKYWSIVNGVAVIPVVGPIAKRMNLFSMISGGTSIEILRKSFDEALASKADPILFHFDSPGGVVTGVPEFASHVFNARENGEKTILALADGQMCSAAYWIGSQCDAVYLTEASSIGSIGVYSRIDSWDRAEKNAGIDSMVFRSHELKGISEGPITPNQADAIKSKVMEYFQMFKDSVARARPGIDLDKVATGLDFIGAKAVSLGLADEVLTYEQLIEIYQN